ncbi:MAG: spermidine/putrescine ABC transporter ATP-binding protein PotA [Gammaproteobacteria bacterium]|nr:spermidine/putrescine ABC transporter ATP-binding protein PotA [Gammaproteobacteria bacterium]
MHYDAQPVLNGFDLNVRDGEFFTLLGPSGCGKTTVLRLIAGFETPTEGQILLDGKDIAGKPAERRPINTVFQSYALFPHLDVYDNVAFGLRMAKTPATEIESRVKEALAMVQLSEYARRKPAQLSGGQKQRVAMARAVVNRPRMLLLDESLSSLDAKLRQQMQIELKSLQRQLGITFIYVTHDQEEALSMSDRLLVMQNGQSQQVGEPREIYEAPVNEFVARFVGEINVFEARVEKQLDNNRYRVHFGDASREISSAIPLHKGDAIKVMLRPEDLRIEYLEDAPARPGFIGEVLERNYKGKTLDSLIRLQSGQEILASEFFNEDDPDFDYRLRQKVWVDWVHGWEHVIKVDG